MRAWLREARNVMSDRRMRACRLAHGLSKRVTFVHEARVLS
jgi:hypothetical protein